MRSHEFNLREYHIILRMLLDKAYRFVDYDNVLHQDRSIVLRHDIDMSLEYALPVAEIEHQLGITSCYFLLLTSEFYNPLTSKAQSAITKIRAFGHEIGLHFDASIYPKDFSIDDLSLAAEKECELLSQISRKSVRYISFHRPVKALQGVGEGFAQRINTYEKRFFETMGYCSDSQGAWRFGHPLDHSAILEGKQLQLLTHPIWWTLGEKMTDNLEKLDYFLNEHHTQMKQEMAANCKTYLPLEAV